MKKLNNLFILILAVPTIILGIYFIPFVSFFFFKQKTAYEILRSDWSSDVCSSDLPDGAAGPLHRPGQAREDVRSGRAQRAADRRRGAGCARQGGARAARRKGVRVPPWRTGSPASARSSAVRRRSTTGPGTTRIGTAPSA